MKFMKEKDQSIVERLILRCSDIEELLDSYLDAEITSGIKARFEKHLEKCEDCQSLVEDCQNIKKIAQSLMEGTISSNISARLRMVLEEKVGHCIEDKNYKRHLTIVKEG